MNPSRQRQRVYSQRRLTNTPYDAAMRYRDVSVNKPSQLGKRHRLRAFIVAALLVGFAGHVLWSKHVSAEIIAAKQAQTQELAQAKQKASNFSQQVNALINQNPGESIGVATASSIDGEQAYGSTDAFDAASTAKLLTAADYLHHVEQGTASLNQNIDGQTAEYWLKIMIINSDDTAWAELNGYLTHDDLVTYGQSIGFTAYDPDNNTMVTSDLAGLLQQLYAGKLLNAADRSLLLGWMAKADYRQYIVAAVPDSDTVYHKVGYDDDTVNDAAIVTNGQKYLVLVIFTDGNGNYDMGARANLIHSITSDAIAAYL